MEEKQMAEYCFGIDIGGTSVKIGLFNLAGEVLEKYEIPTRRENDGEFILSDIAIAIKGTMDKRGLTLEEVIGAGLGVPGPITKDGTVLKCANLGWGVFNVAKRFQELSGIENVKVGNDANVAALGEMWKGGGQGYQNIVMITLGTGVGGGIILDGKILTGVKGAAGEIGHITIREDETDTCGCGKRGCLEQYTSATGIVKETKRLLAKVDTPSSLRSVETITAKDVLDAAKAKDELAVRVIEQVGHDLGLACSHISGVIDPEAYVIGGGVSKAGSIITDVVEKYYDNYVMFALKNKVFTLATLGNDAGIYGCAKMVL